MANLSDASMTAIGDALAGTRPARQAPSDRVAATCHENEVPPFVEAALQRLYANIYSSLPQFHVCGALAAKASTYVVRRGDAVTEVFLFQRHKDEVTVLNEGIAIGHEELQRFASYIFSRYSDANLISFHAIRPDTAQLAYPYQRFNCLEDIVLALPPDNEAYLASMGNSTRNYIKRYLNKLRRSFPSFCHRVYLRQEIDEQQVRDIIALNGARMVDKGKVPGIGAEEMQRIIRLVRECGMVSVVSIDGRVCAGTINYCVGKNYFLEVIAHDPEYNDYRLGTLCCYLTICECIARGGKEYHFLWGKNEYKYRLLGVERALDHLAIYRSRRQLLLHAGTALGNIAKAGRRKAQLRLHAAQAGTGLRSRVALHALRLARGVLSLRRS